MKSTLKRLAILFTVNMLIFITSADSQPNIPASSWEQLSGGIAVALGLVDHRVTISIKNTSNTLKEIIEQGPGSTIQLFYIDDQGTRISLGHHKSPGDPGDGVVQKTPSPIDIPPGGEVSISRAVRITPEELALVKTHPVVCSMIVYDPATKQQSTVESSPKVLTDAVSTAPNK